MCRCRPQGRVQRLLGAADRLPERHRGAAAARARPLLRRQGRGRAESLPALHPELQGCGYTADIPLAQRCGDFCQQRGECSVPGVSQSVAFLLPLHTGVLFTLSTCLRKLRVKTGKAYVLVLQRRRTERRGIYETSGHFICPCHFLSVLVFISLSISQVVWFFLHWNFKGIVSFMSSFVVLMFLSRSDFQMI